MTLITIDVQKLLELSRRLDVQMLKIRAIMNCDEQVVFEHLEHIPETVSIHDSTKLLLDYVAHKQEWPAAGYWRML